MQPTGQLILVPTPLGNLGDITRRAVEALTQADAVACEDTRRTLGLMNHLGLSKPLFSYHAHSSDHKTNRVLEAILNGKTVALVSDAGTPALSDPGEDLVRGAIKEGIPVVSFPGPCAAITALVASGLPTDRFFFIGFLPRRPARAKKALQKVLDSESTGVIYESPFRTKETLEWLQTLAGPALQVVVARELTKVYEEFIRGAVGDVLNQLGDKPLKGEIVILFRTPDVVKEEDTE